MADTAKAFADLIQVLETLLSPQGCPWDREQTPKSLCDYVIEGAFELVEGIRDGNPAEACEELGDVMFLLIFVGTLYQRRGDFSLADALRQSAAKMVRRHPHVFGEDHFENTEELLQAWENIKRKEKEDASADNAIPGVFDSLPKGLPPLLRAYRIHAKAARSGFSWETDEQLEAQLASEWQEWTQARAGGDPDRKAEEFGDYLFTLVELGRRHSIKANAALDGANRKFLSRFAAVEAKVHAQGKAVGDMTLNELNDLWDQAKAEA